VEAAHTLWRPLGRLLVAKGLLTEDQLEHALHDQALTGRRLGEILVDLGYLSRRALSLALAHQYGIDPPTETGFGTGLLAAIQLTREADDAHVTATPDSETPPRLALVPAPANPDPGLEDPIELLPLAGLEEQWAKLAAAEEQLATAERELRSLARTNERRARQVVRLIARLRERDRRLAERSIPEPDPERPESHLLLVQLADRYELVERPGPAPAANTILDLPELCDGKLLVLGLGPAPLPNDRRRCALAQRIPDDRN
jgi:hypothetical protein